MVDITQLIGKKTVVVKRSQNRDDDQALILKMIDAGYTLQSTALSLRFNRIDQKPPRLKR